MFDISFSELLIIAVVALIVIGPEKLPKVARTAGAIIGRMQRYAAQVKEEVNREARFEELQKLQNEIRQRAEGVKSSIVAGLVEEQAPTPEPAIAKPKAHSPRKKPALSPSAQAQSSTKPKSSRKKSVP